MMHIQIIAIMSVAALGVWTAMGEGMILEFIRKPLEKLPSWIHKPLASCPRCMVTIYGTAAVMLLGYPVLWQWWPAYLVCAVGLQEMLHR